MNIQLVLKRKIIQSHGMAIKNHRFAGSVREQENHQKNIKNETKISPNIYEQKRKEKAVLEKGMQKTKRIIKHVPEKGTGNIRNTYKQFQTNE